MRLLIDTHLLVWWLSNDARLPPKARTLMEKQQNLLLVSCTSLWEIAIKRGLGKLQVDLSELHQALESGDFVVIPVSPRHTLEVASLPAHHSDPFDRMLIAQSLVETAHFLTHDSSLKKYGRVVMVV